MDSLASLMFAGEPALKKYMRMKPRRRDESIISRPMAIQIVIMSIWLTILSLVWFKVPFFRACFATEAQWYTGFFCMFVFAFMVNAFNVRSDGLNVFEHIGENKRFIHIWLAIMAVQVLLVSIGGVIGEVFSCVRFGLDGWIAVCLMALTMYPVDLIRKVLTPKPKA